MTPSPPLYVIEQLYTKSCARCGGRNFLYEFDGHIKEWWSECINCGAVRWQNAPAPLDVHMKKGDSLW